MAIPQDPKDITPLKVGDKIPTISLANDKNQLVNVNAELKVKPAVLIFYRGGWCPYCNLQMSSLRTVENEFYELGYNIFGISPDKPSNLALSREKHDFHYQLLSDKYIMKSFSAIVWKYGLKMADS